ncbi:exodeoxyribonuclease V subunit gamma [Candidatus Doolittlea endobia]|uniref:RecBCD enzyme subunit RecC n=1 Tax=Candidatus Doolittlea endobia TaxID=1778262 RepID=A0A143WSJ7_9ENTR|nr:exodeoxyribonuclease V subunit gamma [Candidatus Doolittlea endobia]CUX96725.1 RecBCD enzyme subunit RecC [Candidatus Doolittlea endobia]
MFTIYHSNQLDLLKTLAAKLIAGRPLRDPFQPEIILVQSHSMAQWMKMELAAQLGIAANIDFLLPDSFIWKMFACVLPDIPDKNAFAKPIMTWRLMALLTRLCQHPDCALVNDYLRDDEDKRKSFQFAAQIADLFEQYLVYRPDWLESWQHGELIDGMGETQRWQALLWQTLVAGEPLWQNRANLHQYFVKTLTKSHTRPLGLPDRIFIFGISSLPPTYLQVLQALGRHIDIHFLFTNPCRYYWGDIHDHTFLARLMRRRRQHYQQKTEQALFRQPEQADALFNELGEQQTGNPLLASWGKQGRDSLYLLAQVDDIAEVDAFVEPVTVNLLSLLQRDILMLEDHAVISMSSEIHKHGDSKRLLQLDDRSLTLHICHSPQREVEVLHDSLLAMIAEDPTLRPRDIIVMMPDIDFYTPAIQAVFGNTSGNRYLPFAISDRRARYFHPLLPAFLSLLDLPRSRFSAEQVLALLEIPAIAARFSINEQGLQMFRQWVAESNFRWKLGDDTLHELILSTTGKQTWQFGLTRMLLSYAMDSHSGDWHGSVPYNESSGLKAMLVRQLTTFLMRLCQWRNRLIHPRSLDAWLSCAREISEDFFTPDAEAESALTLLKNQWKQLLEDGLQAGYDQLVPVTLLQSELAERLEKKHINQSSLDGTINFCALMPMSSVPSRVVCLLGMNDGVYPRTLPPTKFDLMVQQPRRGDRSRRDDDRYLFLETLMSTQQRLYISFIGRAIQDNTLRYPSVLVSELSDYIAQSFYLPGDEHANTASSADRVRAHLWNWHSRMPFDPENFLPDNENQSFADEWLPAACSSGKPQPDFVAPLTTLPRKALSLNELLHFYRHPVRAWFVQRLMISFHQTSLELAANEPFVINSLTRYQLNCKLVNTLIDGESTDHLFRQVCDAGLLPYGTFGELYWAKQCQDMTRLAEQVQTWQLPKTYSLKVELSLEGVTLSGWLPQVQQNGLLRWRPGTLSVRDGLLLWLEHLAYCAMGGEGESRMFGIHSEWHFAPLSSAQAKSFLLSLISGYCQGMTTPLLLLPHSGGAWLSHCYDRTTQRIDRDENRQRQAHDKLIQAWQGNTYVPGEGTDPYLQRLIRQLNQQYLEKILSTTERYFLPFFRLNLAQTKPAGKRNKA